MRNAMKKEGFAGKRGGPLKQELSLSEGNCGTLGESPSEVGMATPTPTERVLRFESFELDVRAGELHKGGVKLHLQGQPLQLLVILLQNAGKLVTREELRSQLWPADTFVDFDHSLHNAIARIREVLSDSAETPRYIETLPRRGYRFIAPVEELGVRTDERDAQGEQATEQSRSSRIRSRVVSGLMLALAVGLAISLVQSFSHRASAAGPLRSVAVLPLANLSGDPSQEYFADGMTEQLITDLAKVSSLRVISRTSMMRFKGTKKSLPEIARELNVDGIVEGSVMRSGPRVKITAQLLHGPTDRHLWAESYERDLGDVLKLQDDVAQAIVQQVRAEVTPQQEVRLSSGRPVNPEAYDAYLRGRYYYLNQFTMLSGLNAAKRNFEEAIGKDPDFALAHSGLGATYVFLVYFHGIPPEEGYRLAKGEIQKAQELDDNIGEIHDVLGEMKWRFEWDWNGAEREFNRAIELQPSYSCAHEDRANYLSLMGRRPEAMAEIAKSNAIDPGPSSAMAESASYYLLRDYAAMLEASRRQVLSNPKEWTAHASLAAGYKGTGKLPEAISEFQNAVELSGGDPDPIASLANAYAAIGQKTQAEKILRDLEEKSNRVYVSPYIMATVYAGVGQKDKAFQFLEKAYREKSPEMSWHLKADLRIDSLRSDPRFQELMHRAGLEQ